jgi:D-alanyl-D-alanine carboxypeptidase
MRILKNQLPRNLVTILLFFSVVALVNVHGHKLQEEAGACALLESKLTSNYLLPLYESIEAEGVYSYDFSAGIPLFIKHESTPLPLASLTKLMTMRVALAHSSLDSSYIVKDADLTFDGPTGFVAGDVYSLADITKAAMIASSNNAAEMLAHSTNMSETDFIAAMNAEVETLGLASLNFGSVTGLDFDETTPSALGSAKDILMLLKNDSVDFPKATAFGVEETATIRAESGRTIELANTNKAIKNLPLLTASKTGYTVSAGGNLAVLWQEPGGHTLGAAVLGSSQSGRFTDIVAIHEFVNAYVQGRRDLPAFCTK